MNRETALTDLLLSLFNADEFRRWVRHDPHASEVLDELLGDVAAPRALISEAVATLVRHGHIDLAFFERLRAARPRRAADIDRVAAAWEGSGGSEPHGPSSASPAPPRPGPVSQGGFVFGDHATIHVGGDIVHGTKSEVHYHHEDQAGRPGKVR